MRNYDVAEILHLQGSDTVCPRLLLWLQPKSRITGLVSPMGFWNGDDDASFDVGAEIRPYAAHSLLAMDDLTVETGLQVRTISVWMATASATIRDLIPLYDLRLARAEIHRVLLDPLSMQPIARPHRIWKGWVDGAPYVRPALGQEGGQLTLTIASAAMALTRTLTGKYSDASMRLRGGGVDRLFRYSDVSGKVPVYWGEARAAVGSADGGWESYEGTVGGAS